MNSRAVQANQLSLNVDVWNNFLQKSFTSTCKKLHSYIFWTTFYCLVLFFFFFFWIPVLKWHLESVAICGLHLSKLDLAVLCSGLSCPFQMVYILEHICLLQWNKKPAVIALHSWGFLLGADNMTFCFPDLIVWALWKCRDKFHKTDLLVLWYRELINWRYLYSIELPSVLIKKSLPLYASYTG